MENLLLGLISVTLFCVCAHFFVRMLTLSEPFLNATGYSRAALRIKRGYQVFSWGMMTMVLLIGFVITFYQVYIEL